MTRYDKERFHLLMGCRKSYDSFGRKRNKVWIWTSAVMESLQHGAMVLPTDRHLAAEHQGETPDRLRTGTSPTEHRRHKRLWLVFLMLRWYCCRPFTQWKLTRMKTVKKSRKRTQPKEANKNYSMEIRTQHSLIMLLFQLTTKQY